MTVLINSAVGSNKGKKRVWLEGAKLAHGGFSRGDSIKVERSGKTIVIKIDEYGGHTVSGRSRNGKDKPIIDLSSQEILKGFTVGEPLRITAKKGYLVISQHEITKRIYSRVSGIRARLSAGLPVRSCSLFHGLGVIDRALHDGFARAGIATAISAAVEIEGNYLDASIVNNQAIWSDDSIAINSPIQLVNPSPKFQVDMLVAGVPCTGASKAGRTKNKLKNAESHIEAGALFHYMLRFIEVLNPALVVLENVAEYAGTASMAVIRAVLSDNGYHFTERILGGNDYGALEDRQRLCVVAVTKGLDFNLDDEIKPVREKEDSIDKILEPVEDDSPRWKACSYLAKKEVRDIAAGKGFRRQVLTGSEPKCGSCGKGYSKIRSTEPQIAHPTETGLSRLFTPIEHAAIKGVPKELIAGLSDTVAHECLGQSVVFPAFEAVGAYIGEQLSSSFIERSAV